MRGDAVVRALAAGSVLLVALSGCMLPFGSSKDKDGGGKTAGGPPPGGWPQPENGRLTEKMCGLLTDADYAKYGHQRLPAEAPRRFGANGVDCMHMTNDELTLNLQPTAESARLLFAGDLKDHKDKLAENGVQSMLAMNVVQGADESWFDRWTLSSGSGKFPEYEIKVRRGSLIVGIVLSGIHGKNEKDPKEILTGLAGLVLQRIPNVGKVDTGKTHKIHFQVLGRGRAKSISYYDPSEGKTVKLANVPLPWKADKPLASMGDQPVTLNLNATSSAPLAPLQCAISVDGKPIVTRDPSPGFALCFGTYTETKN